MEHGILVYRLAYNDDVIVFEMGPRLGRGALLRVRACAFESCGQATTDARERDPANL
jgi:carbamoylphosphate synthase large subunit